MPERAKKMRLFFPENLNCLIFNVFVFFIFSIIFQMQRHNLSFNAKSLYKRLLAFFSLPLLAMTTLFVFTLKYLRIILCLYTKNSLNSSKTADSTISALEVVGKLPVVKTRKSAPPRVFILPLPSKLPTFQGQIHKERCSTKPFHKKMQ